MNLIDTLTKKSTVMAGILILAIILRLYHYTANPLWIDEGWTLYVSQHGWIESMFLDVHPPVYYWLVKVVTSLFGVSEAVIRMPSLVFGIIGVALIYFFTAEFVKSDWAGVVAAGLLAVSYDHIFHSQDARNYTVWLVVFMAFAICYLRAMDAPQKIKWWVYAGALAGVCMWVHYWSIFPLTFMAIYALWRQKKYVKQVVVGLAAFAVVFIPLIPVFVHGITIKSVEGWTIFHPWNVILQNTWSMFANYDAVLGIFFALLTVIGLWVLLEDRDTLPRFELAVLLFLSTALVFLATSPWFMTIPKYAMYLLPFVYALIGLGVCTVVKPYVAGRKWFAIAAIWVLIVMAATPLPNYYAQVNRDGWYDNNAMLTEITDGKPIAVLANPGLAMQWAYYYDGECTPFRTVSDLETIIMRNPNGTFIYVPASEIPPDLPEAQQIDQFLHDNGVPVAVHRGFNGWWVG